MYVSECITNCVGHDLNVFLSKLKTKFDEDENDLLILNKTNKPRCSSLKVTHVIKKVVLLVINCACINCI